MYVIMSGAFVNFWVDEEGKAEVGEEEEKVFILRGLKYKSRATIRDHTTASKVR